MSTEIEVLLKEYEALRAEILSRQASLTQLPTIAIVLIGGMITLAPFLLSFDSQGLHLRVPLIYLILILLIISLLFSSLQWTHMLHDVEIAHIAKYIQIGIRKRACQLIGTEELTARIFNWDSFHLGLVYSTTASPVIRLSIPLLGLSRYGLISIPALLSLVFASSVYLSNFAILTVNGVGWITFGLFIFDLLYLLAIIPYIPYIQRIQRSLI